MRGLKEISDIAGSAVREAGFSSGGTFGVSPLYGVSAALFTNALALEFPRRTLLAITSGADEAEALYSDFRTLGVEAYLLCAPEVSEKPDVEREAMRLAVAKALSSASSSSRGLLIVTSRDALLAPMPDPGGVESAGTTLRVGADIPFEELIAAVAKAGYSRVAEVAAKGEFALRGGLIDIWPPTSDAPHRAEFFGDTLDELRVFDPATQISLAAEKPAELWVSPCANAEVGGSPLVECAPEGAIALWLELPPEENSAALASRAPFLQIFSGLAVTENVERFIDLGIKPAPCVESRGTLEDFEGVARRELLAKIAERAASGETAMVALDTAGAVEWLSRETGWFAIERGVLSGGCDWPALSLVILAQSDVYAARRNNQRRFLPAALARSGVRPEKSAELAPGELVVHIDHGIGRYEGTREIELDGRKIEALTIRYAEGALLHVPVAHAHLLSRYIAPQGSASRGKDPTKGVKLHSLDGKRWRSECLRAERSIVDYAAALLEVQARRAVRQGNVYDVATPWMEAFEGAFPYNETPDQEKCIAAIKSDLASPRPMDRLICGDAGYGKTEIAMRAVFAVVMNGKQAAVLAPTTVLAEQHFETFRERMQAFPLRIEVLSRLRTPTQRRGLLRDLEEGKIDVIIGTHSLLQPGIKFADLGLLVVDEEQRFGVVHKERMKQFRATLDVLTLSATPIPRTLYMSMTGVRDMSLLQTPPQERLAIETTIARDSDEVIRKAIRRELKRNGQVFFLHNRVLTMDIVFRRLQEIVPEARISVAHGQMTPAELAQAMKKFLLGEANVLLCTTIIESGLDIPRANTIIINRADRFGLADLYQLRGRVGRSSKRGFALLLVPRQGVIDADARQRLDALNRHGGLGGGLNLAMRDLEIRGAGNILGAEQSGHIAAIGFGLYCQLLKRTIARLKGEKPALLVDVTLDLDFVSENSAAKIPYDYIEDATQRMNIHRRLAEASADEEVRGLRGELADRFGAPPPEVVRMLRLAELRIAAAKAGIARVRVEENIVRLFRRNGAPILDERRRFPRMKATTPDRKITELFRIIGTMSRQ